MDQSCIYLLIAGTYTPIALINLYGVFGFSIFTAIWSLSILGIYLKIKNIQPFPNFELFLCLFMGWFALIGIKGLMNTMDINGMILIFVGGLLFSIGVLFYISKKLSYGHAIWHLFYISGCICHYFTIVLYTMPYNI
jgi:hemolysin III